MIPFSILGASKDFLLPFGIFLDLRDHRDALLFHIINLLLGEDLLLGREDRCFKFLGHECFLSRGVIIIKIPN
jgi:hypothetical protein